MKVYIVEEGVYSDRYIVAVFLNKEKAEYFSKYHCYDISQVLEFDTSDDDYEIAVKEKSYFNVIMGSSGNILSVNHFNFCYSPGTDSEKEIPQEFFAYDSKDNSFVGSIATNSEDQAVKIMHDKRAQWLAEKFGI